MNALHFFLCLCCAEVMELGALLHYGLMTTLALGLVLINEQ